MQAAHKEHQVHLLPGLVDAAMMLTVSHWLSHPCWLLALGLLDTPAPCGMLLALRRGGGGHSCLLLDHVRTCSCCQSGRCLPDCRAQHTRGCQCAGCGHAGLPLWWVSHPSPLAPQNSCGTYKSRQRPACIVSRPPFIVHCSQNAAAVSSGAACWQLW